MKRSELSFVGGMLSNRSKKAFEEGKGQKSFDWDLAANIIREAYKKYPDLLAEAGLQRDWDYTGGIIFKNGEPVINDYTYLSSYWAIPTLILSWDNKEQEEIECYTTEKSRFNEKSKWDEISLAILNDEP